MPPLGERLTGALTIIGRGGGYLRAPHTIEIDTVTRLRIEWRASTFQTWARVANYVPGEGMGVAFLETEESQIGVLNRWLQELAAGSHSASLEDAETV